MIVSATVIGRESGSAELILAPLNDFVEAKEQPEMYRSMLANVCLFVPLGAFVGNGLAGSKAAAVLKTRNIIALTAMIGLGVSLAVEILQYAYGLGRAEVDDLICNTVGMAVGSLSVLISSKKDR